MVGVGHRAYSTPYPADRHLAGKQGGSDNVRKGHQAHQVVHLRRKAPVTDMQNNWLRTNDVDIPDTDDKWDEAIEEILKLIEPDPWGNTDRTADWD